MIQPISTVICCLMGYTLSFNIDIAGVGRKHGRLGTGSICSGLFYIAHFCFVTNVLSK